MKTITWRDLTAEHDRAGWPSLLLDATADGILAPAEVARALASVWPYRGRDEMPLDAWLSAFRALGGHWAEEGAIRDDRRPTAPLRLYRAASPEWRGGLSWSDRYLAATYLHRPGAVMWTALVPPEAMLARYRGAEFIVDTIGLEITPAPYDPIDARVRRALRALRASRS